MSNNPTQIIGKNLNQTILINGVTQTDITIEIKVPAYPLIEFEFEKLISPSANWIELSFQILLGSFMTLLLTVLTKMLLNALNPKHAAFEVWELWACIITLVLAIVLKLVSLCMNTHRSKLIKKIKQHLT